MLTAYLFDERRERRSRSGPTSSASWARTSFSGSISSTRPTKRSARSERASSWRTPTLRAARRRREPELELADDHIRVTAIAVSDEENDAAREAVVVDCLHRRELGR